MSIVETIVKQIAPHWSARRVSLLLTIIAIVLWSYSTVQAKLNIGFLGLIHSFPIYFFIALALLTVASAILWGSPENHEKLLFLQWSVLIAAIWLNPLLLGATGLGAAPCPNGQFGNIEYIIRQGYLFPVRLIYHNWPASWIFISVLMEIAGINDVSLLNAITPIALQFLFLLPLYLFLRNMLGEDKRNYCWAGLWIFTLGNWVPQSYLSAQAFGYFLFLTTLFLLTKISPWQRSEGVPGYQVAYLLPLILILACLPMTHLFTSFMVLSIIIALYVVKKAKASSFSFLPMTVAVFIAAWTIYGSTWYLRVGLPVFVSQAFRLDVTTAIVVTNYALASDSYQAIVLTRILLGIIFVGIAFAGGILGRKVDRSSNITGLAIAAGSLAIALFFGYGYGAELVHRIFFFMLPVMAYFGVKLLNRKAWAVILCLLLILLLPMHIISHYGAADADRESPGEIAGTYFFHDYTTDGICLAGYMIGKIKYAERYSEHLGEWFHGDLGYPEGDILGYLNELPPERPHYVAINRSWKVAIKFSYNDTQFVERVKNSLDNAPSCTLFYVNPDLSLYLHQLKE